MSKFRKPGNWWTPASGRLTEEQATAFADVITAWSLLELTLQKVLCVLAQAPLALGQALTEDLGPDNRIKALKRLAQTWKAVQRYNLTVEQRIALTDCLVLATWIAQVKARRNQIAHWNWLRQDDEEIFGFKYNTRPSGSYADQNNRPQTHATETVTTLDEFSEQISVAAHRLQLASELLQTLPTWPRTRIEVNVEQERPESSGQSEPVPPRPTSDA